MWPVCIDYSSTSYICSSARNIEQKLVNHFLKMECFIGYYYTAVLLKLYGPDFDWPNAKIGRKMANCQLLFLALMFSSLKIVSSVTCTSVLKW